MSTKKKNNWEKMLTNAFRILLVPGYKYNNYWGILGKILNWLRKLVEC